MRPRPLSEVARAVDGRLRGTDATVTAVVIDSREAGPGSLFFAMPGGRRDGHDFATDALSRGAVGSVVHRPVLGEPAVEVADSGEALLALAADERARMPDATVIGITGANGKTSTKDLAASILSTGFLTHASPGSFNNEIGLPLTLLGAPEGVEVVLTEMGARRRGDHAELCRVAKPDAVVVTNIGVAHMEVFGSWQAIVEASAEPVEALAVGSRVRRGAERGGRLPVADGELHHRGRRARGERRVQREPRIDGCGASSGPVDGPRGQTRRGPRPHGGARAHLGRRARTVGRTGGPAGGGSPGHGGPGGAHSGRGRHPGGRGAGLRALGGHGRRSRRRRSGVGQDRGRRPGQGVAGGRAGTRGRGPSMRAILLAAAVGLAVTLLGTPVAIRAFRLWGWGQHIREDGPHTHLEKMGTPTMGGAVIVAGMVASYLVTRVVFTTVTAAGLSVVFAAIGLGMVGFIDDLIKVRRQRSLGLSKLAKVAGQALVALGFGLIAVKVAHLPTDLSFIRDTGVNLGLGFYLWVFLILASSSNSVNLTDGLDGLASGAAILVLSAYVYIAFWQFRHACTVLGVVDACYPVAVNAALDTAIVAGGAVGAVAGFLWWNAAPARIFMGDTGALALGGLIGALAIVTSTQLLLVVLGGRFVLETTSVIVQVIAFRGLGRRLFRLSPLPHNFELARWPEFTVIVRFWIIAGMCVAIAIGLFYADFLARGGTG